MVVVEHHPECWKEEGHHQCALKKIQELQEEIRRMDQLCRDCGRLTELIHRRRNRPEENDPKALFIRNNSK